MEQNAARGSYRIYWQKTLADAPGARILRMYGTSARVEAPSHLGGCPVTELAGYCFSPKACLPQEYEVARIQPPGADASLLDAACFELCGDRVEELILPAAVMGIGDYALYNCRKLRCVEFGTKLVHIGSDAFMNCHNLHQLRLRGGVKESSGLRQILAQISWDVEALFFAQAGTGPGGTADSPDCAVFYPEYFESYDEIAPAHIFGRSVNGEGFRARQSFRSGTVDFALYDSMFPKVCAEEAEHTVCRIALDRLRYPTDLTPGARSLYENYIRGHSEAAGRLFIQERRLDMLGFLYERKLLAPAAAQRMAVAAAESGWGEGSAGLMRLQQQYYPADAFLKERYKIEW